MDDFFGSEETAEAPAEAVEATEPTQESVETAETAETETSEETSETAEGEEPSPAEAEETSEETITRLEKQVKDTQNWATKQNQSYTQKLSQIEQGQQVIQQKLDGTYVEPTAPGPQETAQLERVNTSMAAAVDKFGSKEIFDKIEREGSPVRELIANDPQAANRIMSSPLPYVEAMNVLAEREVMGKYGGNSITEMIDNAKTAERESLREELTASITKDIMDKMDSAAGQPGSLRDVKSSPGTTPKAAETDFFAAEY